MMNDNQEGKELHFDPDILPKAQGGDTFAQVILAKTYFNAIYLENNCLHAFEWFTRSAKDGNMEAQFLLANLYALGQGTRQSHVDAYKWYFEAALQGYKKALIRVHNLYQQDKKLHCRGKLNSEEERRIKEYDLFWMKYYYRELNEQRVEDYRLKFSGILTAYLEEFIKYNSYKCEDPDTQLKLAFLYQHGYGVKKSILLAFELYEKAAEKGHRDAQYHLAVLYQQNKNIKFNYRKSLRWYRASATNGNVAAQNNLAYFYEKGLSIEVDYEGAIYWYTKAASAGNSDAQLNLGRIYRKGQGTEQSFLEAARWYRLAALQGNNAAQNCLNQLFQRGKLNNHSDAEVVLTCEDELSSKTTLYSILQNDINKLNGSPKIKKLIKLVQHALMTDGNAMHSIGLKYYNGEDFPQDKDTGFQWIKKAAKAGNQKAEMQIAKMYEDGDAVEQDYHESSKWITKLANKKNPKAQCNLGIMYKNGLGVRRDPLEASKWFIKSGDRGNSDALYQFGLLKFDGEGVSKDREEAFKYFYRSALLRQPDALFRLGYMYENGDSVDKDQSKAVKMYEDAAKCGYIHAQFRLGRIYEEGSLTQKNLVKALEYYTKAADSGGPSYRNELAIKYLNGIFDDPNFTKAYELIKQENLIESVIFKRPIIHFSKIDGISKIIDMLILIAEQGVEHVAFELGYAYEFGIEYRNYSVNYYNNHSETSWYSYLNTGKYDHDTFRVIKWDRITFIEYAKTLEWYRSGNEKLIYSDYGNHVSSSCAGCQDVFYGNYENSIKWYLTAASKEDSRAYYRLGAMYEIGKGVKKNLKTSFNYYSQAYKNGNKNAAYSLALLYLNGNGVSQDLIKAFYLFSEASCMGDTDANEILVPSRARGNLQMLEAVATLGHVAIQYQLGVFYEEEEDYINSFKWLSLAAQGEITDACYRLGLLYEEGRGTNIDHEKAINLYEKASRRDRQEALYRLARLYHHGKVIECDYLKAYNYYTKAAKLDHKDAQKLLDTTERPITHSYENNQEGTSNVSSTKIKDSLLLLKSVAKHGNIELQYSLGAFYYRVGENQDYEEAFSWFNMAADNDHVEAIFHLGLLYEKGLGVEQDYNKSFELFQRANRQGSHYALYRLGIAFHHGYGVDRSTEDALNCYIKAAVLENHESQYTLGLLYKNGDLVLEDTVKALFWFTKAHKNGNRNAINSLLEMYDDTPYEYYFHEKLFRNLSKINKDYRNDNTINNETTYGRIYFTLGKLYFEGFGTTKDYAESLSHFLKAYHIYDYSSAEEYLPLEYKDSSFAIRNDYVEMLQAYSAIADDLDGDQLYQLGMLYHDGAEIYSIDQNTAYISAPIVIVQKDEKMAFQYIRLAAKKGDSEARRRLGHMYLEGNGIQQDYYEAIKWFNSASETIKPHECYIQGMAYVNNIKMDKSLDISYIYLKKAAEKKHVLAQLAIISLQDNDVENNNEYIIESIRDSVKLLTPDHCYHIGMTLYEGIEVDKNYEISSIYLQKAAGNNHALAQAQLGVMYYLGQGVDKNKDEATKWIEKSLIEMDPYECYNQGMRFYEGNEVERDYEISFIYIKKAAEKNYDLALAQLGFMYFQGNGVEKNFNEAVKYIDQSLEEMYPSTCYTQGLKVYENSEVEKDYKLSLKYLRKAATKNFPKAQAQIGQMYLEGKRVEKNRAKAMHWIKQSAKEMDPNDCYEQGMKFYTGTEVEKDREIALLYLKMAAERDEGNAQAQLGLFHLQGDGVEKNYEEAMKWIEKSVKNIELYDCYYRGIEFYKAIELERNYDISLLYLKKGAKEGDPYSQAQLAYMYSKGIGVDKDLEQATRWRNRIKYGYPKHRGISLAQIYHYDEGGIQDFSKALEYYQNEIYNCDFRGIGLLYEHGDGVDQDYKKAMKYYKKSANKYNICAYYRIGLLYYYGRGVNQSYTDALRWFTKLMRDHISSDTHHVFVRDDSSDILTFAGYTEKKYSFQPESIFIGAAHYYLGLMHKDGHGTVQNNDRAQAHFRKSFGYGIKRASEYILQ